MVAALLRAAGVTAACLKVMAAYRRVYDSRHRQADCQEPGSARDTLGNRVWVITFTFLPISSDRGRFASSISTHSQTAKYIVYMHSVQGCGLLLPMFRGLCVCDRGLFVCLSVCLSVCRSVSSKPRDALKRLNRSRCRLIVWSWTGVYPRYRVGPGSPRGRGNFGGISRLTVKYSECPAWAKAIR